MATVSEALAREIIANDGYYADDPRVHQVIKYTNKWGTEAWAVLYERDVLTNRYAPSKYVQDPEIVWQIGPTNE